MSDWDTLARALRQLHRALLQRASGDYARDHGIAEEIGPGELLMLTTRDDYFSWLRSLSELMADIDYLHEQPAATRDLGVRAAVRGAVETLLTPAAQEEAASAFSGRYWGYVHEDPAVTMAHAAVKQALQSWPARAGEDARDLAEHRRKFGKEIPR